MFLIFFFFTVCKQMTDVIWIVNDTKQYLERFKFDLR